MITTASPDRAGAVLSIDLRKIVANWQLLRARVAPAQCAAVVKADAYGLGNAQVAPALLDAGCKVFFVATIDEGIALQQTLRDSEAARIVHVLNGIMPATETDLAENALRPVLNSLGEIDAWAALARRHGRPLPAALHVDTGMSRLGLTAEDLNVLADDPSRLDGIRVTLVMSHLACADDPEQQLNVHQLAMFSAARVRLPSAASSLANSSGIFLGADFWGDLVRPGAALYGIAPVPGQPNPMQAVVRLHGRIVQVREIDTGSTVGYGATHQAAGRERIATVAVGYADGFLRSLSNRGSGYIGSRRVPLVGRVSMDLITFDVSDIPPSTISPGDMVELIGPHHSVDAIASEAGTIGYEILTSLGARYARVYEPART